MGAIRNSVRQDRRRLATAEKRAKALDLRIKGYSLRAISRELRLGGPESARLLVKDALQEVYSPKVHEIRAEVDERDRLILRQFVPIVEDVDAPFADRCDAAKMVFNANRELRAIHGADAPIEMIQVTTEVAVKDVRQQLLDKLARLAERAGEGPADQQPDG